jgi:aminopeptidase N
MGLVDDVIAGRSLILDSSFVDAARAVISSRSDGTDLSLIAYTLSLPTEGMLADTMREGTVDPGAIHTAREFVVKQLSELLHHEFHAAYTELASGSAAYQYTGEAISKRRLANMALRYLCAGGTAEAAALAKAQLESADNMTDEHAAFECLLDCSCMTEAERTAVIQAFERRWEHDALVMDSWFGSQAVAKDRALEAVRKLLEHPQFKITNPNKVRSLVGRFAMSNLANFHDRSGAGYAFLAEFITQLDPINPQAAARMTTAFRTWRRLEPGRRGKARSALETIRDQPGASPDTYEVAMKTLGDVLTEVAAEAEVAAAVEQ